jgi:hypothetical protein
MTLQYSLVIFPTNFLFGRLSYFHPLLFILGPKNLFIFAVLTLALMIDKTSSPKFHRPQLAANQITSYGHILTLVQTHANKNQC